MAKSLQAKERILLEADILRYFQYKYKIPKSGLFDNEVYYDAYYTDKRYSHIYGGRGSGKSNEMIGKFPIVLIMCLPFCRVLMVRQVFNSIKGSCFQEIKDYIGKFNLWKHFKITESPMRILHIASGNSISFAGMDKPMSIKSTKDVTHVIFEEAFQITDEEGIDIIDKSVRTPRLTIGQHRLIFVYNPDNKNHWLYRDYHDPATEEENGYKRDNCYILKTTHHDNKFVNRIFRELLEKDKTANPERYKVDALGEFGSLQVEGLFYQNFNYADTVIEGLKKTIYDNAKPIHITLDFNVYPYISLIVNQIVFDQNTGILKVCVIQEICLTSEGKRGKLDESLKVFMQEYSSHIGNVYVYGDRSGHNRKTTGKADFATVFAMLRKTKRNEFVQQRDAETGKQVTVDPYPFYEKYGCRFKTIDATNKSQNPQLIGRKVLFNRLQAGQLTILPVGRAFGTVNANGEKRLLSAQYGGKLVVMQIDEKCIKLVKDYQEVTEDIVNGGKSSRPMELTHTSDAQDYFIVSLLDCEFNAVMNELKY